MEKTMLYEVGGRGSILEPFLPQKLYLSQLLIKRTFGTKNIIVVKISPSTLHYLL